MTLEQAFGWLQSRNMDVFYYWKSHDEDLREGRIGWAEIR